MSANLAVQAPPMLRLASFEDETPFHRTKYRTRFSHCVQATLARTIRMENDGYGCMGSETVQGYELVLGDPFSDGAEELLFYELWDLAMLSYEMNVISQFSRRYMYVAIRGIRTGYPNEIL